MCEENETCLSQIFFPFSFFFSVSRYAKSDDSSSSYYATQKKVLEINPRHPLIKKLNAMVQVGSACSCLINWLPKTNPTKTKPTHSSTMAAGHGHWCRGAGDAFGAGACDD
jgi:hypothetical protein